MKDIYIFGYFILITILSFYIAFGVVESKNVGLFFIILGTIHLISSLRMSLVLLEKYYKKKEVK